MMLLSVKDRGEGGDRLLWQEFQEIAKQNNTTASALLVRYVQGVVKSGCIDSSPQSTPQGIDSTSQISIAEV